MFLKQILSIGLCFASLGATTALGQNVDSSITRITDLVSAGQRDSARTLTDSLVRSISPDAPRYVDLLFLRARTASSAADAEREYLRIAVEHSLSPRAPEALQALAALEYARGERTGARRHYDKLVRDYPGSREYVRASLWSGRLAIEDRDASGCATLQAARPKIAASDIELRNQFDYFIGQCSLLPPVDTTSTPTSAAPSPRPIAAAAESTPAGTEFSVQVAAYSARADATALANRLKSRGFDVRVVGTRAPYRVRIGRYATRALAVAALGRMRTSQVDGIVVEAEPR